MSKDTNKNSDRNRDLLFQLAVEKAIQERSKNPTNSAADIALIIDNALESAKKRLSDNALSKIDLVKLKKEVAQAQMDLVDIPAVKLVQGQYHDQTAMLKATRENLSKHHISNQSAVTAAIISAMTASMIKTYGNISSATKDKRVELINHLDRMALNDEQKFQILKTICNKNGIALDFNRLDTYDKVKPHFINFWVSAKHQSSVKTNEFLSSLGNVETASSHDYRTDIALIKALSGYKFSSPTTDTERLGVLRNILSRSNNSMDLPKNYKDAADYVMLVLLHQQLEHLEKTYSDYRSNINAYGKVPNFEHSLASFKGTLLQMTLVTNLSKENKALLSKMKTSTASLETKVNTAPLIKPHAQPTTPSPRRSLDPAPQPSTVARQNNRSHPSSK